MLIFQSDFVVAAGLVASFGSLFDEFAMHFHVQFRRILGQTY